MMANTLERVQNGLRFNCPVGTCNAGIGELCLSRFGNPMGHYIHPERIPQADSEFDEMRLRIWLSAFGDLLNE